MRRRDLLAGATAAGAITALGQPARAQGVREISASFAPVKVSRDRIVRSVVGLRPFRETGFRLERVKVGRLDVVHNYGHGGGGVSLSWGCAEMAAEFARDTNRNEIAVLGSGVIGLTTALVLQRAGAQVTIYAEKFPPDTTSNIAAASWYPTTVYRRDKIGETFYGALDHASQRAFRRFQHLANNPRYGVFWIRHHNLRNAAPAVQEHFPGGDAMFVGLRRNQEGHGPFGFAHWDAYYTLMIDPDIFLPALIDDFTGAGGKMVQQGFETVKDVERLKQRTIVNCTGLGARALFDDPVLIPVRGQLSMLLPQPEIDYGYATSVNGGNIYMFPRKSAIVLGGTATFDDWNLDVDEADITRMLEGHAYLAGRAAM